MKNQSKKIVIILAMAALVLAVFPRFAGKAQAASLPQFATVVVRLDKITAQTYTMGTVCIATPASSSGITGFGTENFVDIGFPAEDGIASAGQDFQVNTTPANWISDVYGGTPPSAGTGSAYWPTIKIGGTGVAPIQWPGIGATAVAATNGAYTTGAPKTLKVVRFATTALATDKTYCFDFLDGSGTPGAETAGTYSMETPVVGTNGYQEDVPGYVETYNCTVGCTTVGAGTGIQASNWGTQIEADNTIVISAVVPPIFEMDFTSNVDSFPTNLDPNSIKQTTGNTVTVKTNAKGGWMIWTKSKNQALTSAASGGSIPSVGWHTDAVTALVAGTPGYNENVGVVPNVNGAGTTLCTAQPETEYGGAGTLALFEGGELTPNWEMAADCSTSTPPGTDAGTNVTFIESAAISFGTPASADYTDTIYVTGAGQF
jgi:hypothetical protein